MPRTPMEMAKLICTGRCSEVLLRATNNIAPMGMTSAWITGSMAQMMTAAGRFFPSKPEKKWIFAGAIFGSNLTAANSKLHPAARSLGGIGMIGGIGLGWRIIVGAGIT